jgi:menaquinone-dependent protoporphyrinogen IX oxidase
MYRMYSFFTRWTMKKNAKKGGLPTDTSRNHEFTVWDAVGHSAEAFADALE